MKEKFGKEYKLCSKIEIDKVFTHGFHISQFPLKAFILKSSNADNIPFKVLISVPKKRFKKAATRNYIKRILRESIRKNKLNLETFLLQNNLQLAICISYSSAEEITYFELEAKVNRLMNKIINHVSE
ncbi:MAG: ribonuclease P protein component [Bacteroidota bacterium]